MTHRTPSRLRNIALAGVPAVVAAWNVSGTLADRAIREASRAALDRP